MPYNHLLLDLVLDVVRLDLEALHILPLGLVPRLDRLVFLILPPCPPRVCLFLIKYASLISASKYEKRKWTTLLESRTWTTLILVSRECCLNDLEVGLSGNIVNTHLVHQSVH